VVSVIVDFIAEAKVLLEQLQKRNV